MNKDSISKKQMQLLMFGYPVGSYLLFNMGAGVKQDAWIASIIGVILSIPILMMYGKLMSLYPGKNLFDILEVVFGKVVGKILSCLFIFHITFIAAYILNNFIDFVKVTSLWNTPIFVPMLCMGVLSAWIVNKGIEVIWSWAKVNIRIVLIFLILTAILLIPQMHISNLHPIFYYDFKKIFKEGISLAVYPFIELFIFLPFFDTLESDCNLKNIFIKPVVSVGILVAIITIVNIMVLGGDEYSNLYYPGYDAMKRINIRGEFQRLEIVVSIIFTIMRFLEINYCLIGACKGVQKVFNLKDYRDILIPVSFLVINFAYIIFGSLMEASEFVADLWTFYGFLLEVVFPTIIFIVAFIKKRYFSA